MKFKDTKRCSPVIYGGDKPWTHDLFHHSPEAIPDTVKGYSEYIADNNVVTDVEWWNEQERRCKEGIFIPDAIEKGGDAYVDEKDVFWNDSPNKWRYLEKYDYNIAPNSCYIPQYNLLIKDRTIRITGHHYFYLNFWKIYRKVDGEKRKDVLPPKFIDIDFFFWRRMEMMYEQDKDDSEAKARQKGFSEKLAALLGWNFTFMRSSLNIVAGGMSDDADHTMENTQRGLKNLINTQFYKERDKNKSDYWRAKNFKSELRSISCKDNAQAISRFTPTLIIYEEVGKWKAGLIKEAREFVDVSLQAENAKTGFAVYIGCVMKNSKVYSKKGEVLNIEDVIENDGIIGFDKKAVKFNIEALKLPFKKECYRLTTNSGAVLECSWDHPIMISRNKSDSNVDTVKHKKAWFEIAANIKIKDQLLKPVEIPVFGNKEEKNALLFGLLIGDGNYSFNSIPTLSVSSDDLFRYISKHYKIGSYIRSKPFKDGTGVHKKINVLKVQRLLKENGMYGQSKLNKRLPYNIHEYNKESVANLLKGYFEADGNVKVKKGGKNVSVILTSVVKELIEEVKYQLLKFGIHPIISKEFSKGGYTEGHSLYRLYINNYDDVIKYRDNIGFVSEYKNVRLRNVKKKNGRNLIKKAVFCNDGSFTDRNFTEREIFNELRYETVKKIEYLGYRDVYNLQASGKHNYLVNGFITHNTGGNMEEGAQDLQDFHYDPEAINILSFENKWDREMNLTQRTGHFTPADLFKVIDDEGNSLKAEGRKAVLDERAKKKPKDRYTHTTQQALYASDAFLIATGGYFGEEVAQRCNMRLSYLQTHKEAQLIERGWLRWKNRNNKWEGVYFDPDEEGPFKILEHPILDEDGKPFESLYVAGTDSYDQDESFTTTSQGACWIKKRFLNSDTLYNTYVAGIVERPETSVGGKDVFYEDTALMTMYYGAKNLIEWSKIFIFDWYTRNGVEGLLKERPEFFLAKVITASKATNFYGIDPSTKLSWLSLMAEWLKELDNIDKIYFPELLKAWAKFKYIPGKTRYNCDITISTSLCETFQKDIYEIEVVSRNASKEDYSLPVYRRVNGVITLT